MQPTRYLFVFIFCNECLLENIECVNNVSCNTMYCQFHGLRRSLDGCGELETSINPLKKSLASAHAWEGVTVKLGLFTDGSEAATSRTS